MNGHRVRGGLSGLFFGLGVAILLQQFGIVPLTTVMLVALPGGMALLGVGVGWPRRTISTPTTGS
jgi:hypothetical protein